MESLGISFQNCNNFSAKRYLDAELYKEKYNSCTY